MAARKSLRRHSSGRPTPPARTPKFVLLTLGTASLSQRARGRPATILLGPGKLVALLVYLACVPGRRARTEELVDLLWSNSDDATGHHDLRQAIWQLRRRLGHHAIASKRGEVVLSAPLILDRDDFLTAVDSGAGDRAMALYGGDFLAGLAPTDADSFERWASLEAYRLRRLFTRTAEPLVRQAISAGHHGEATRLARRVRDADAQEEGAWVLLLEALLAAGDPGRAAAEADLLERVLEMDRRAPEPRTRALLRRVRLAAEQPAPTEAPTVLTPKLVGREGELTTLIRAWDRARTGSGRHVHIVGGAGLGKTRLLRELRTRLHAVGEQARYVAARFPARRIVFGYLSELAAAVAALPGAPGVSPAAAAALVALNPSLSNRFAVPPDAARDDEAVRRRALALLELVSAVGEEAPLALLCDDLQWADPLSADVLEWVLGNLGAARVLCVTVSAAGWHGAASETEQLVLAPLSRETIRALVSSIAPLPAAEWAGQFPQLLHTASGGAPRVVIERLEEALERGSLGLTQTGWGCPDATVLARQLATPPLTDPVRLLVAPFVGEGVGVADDHLVDGLTEGLISDLSAIRALRVISRASAMQLKGTSKDPATMGRELAVRHVVMGTVRRAEDRLQIHAELIDAKRNERVWSNSYIGFLQDLLDIQEKLAREIPVALRLQLSPEERRWIGERPIGNAQAYECYLRAKHDMWLLTRDALDRAVGHLESGLDLAGANELLYATLGEAHLQYVNAGLASPALHLRKAQECVTKVFKLNANSAKGHVLSGFMLAFDEPSNIQGMVRQMKRALAIDPNNPEALLWLVADYGISGKCFAARPFLERLLALDPLPAQHQLMRGYVENFDGRHKEAVALLRRAHEIDPVSLPMRFHYAMALLWSGLHEEANLVIDKLAQEAPGTIFANTTSFVRYALVGNAGRAHAFITAEIAAAARRHPLLPLLLAEGCALLRETNDAFDWLETATQRGFVNYPFLAQFDPLLANLHGEPGFAARMEHVKRQWEDFEV